VSAVVVAFGLAWAFLALSRWGRRNVDSLVSPTLSTERRAREEKRLRRGARSLLILSVVCAILGIVAGAAMVAGWS